ncbi:hypothetical protein QE152_g8054 [Popillia japonica]|uniref:Uncharacterized protein n=1 Tax=Popillia japonica TaxID=7064 RepID=A0AAW1M5L3_POPJA
MADSNPISLPIEAGWTSGDSPAAADSDAYREMIATRPDLAYAVNVASRAQAAPIEAHVQLVKRILRYLKGTINDGIQFKKTLYTTIGAYSDADHAGDKLTRRSTSGMLMKNKTNIKTLSHSLLGHHSHVTMKHIWTLALLVLSLCSFSESKSLTKRQINVEAHIEPGHGEHHQDVWRDKKKVEAKFGIKNALLGFVFNKINSFIDQKTHWVDQLDKTNIAKNKAQGIYPPKDPVISLTGIITETVGQKLQAAGPLIGVVVQKLTSSSGGLLGGGSAHSAPAPAPAVPVADHSSASAGFGIGNLIGSLTAVKGFGSGGGHAGGYIGR